MKNRILEILKNSEDYVSGQDLCRELGISRSAVWKNINTLKNKGYIIDAVNNKGYKLIECPDVICPEEISKRLNTNVLGRKLFYYDETDSTNLKARADGEKGEADGSLYIADKQTLGRGRRGRSWDSPKGTAIFMSYLLKPGVDISCVSRITIVAAMAVAEALGHIDGVEAGIKWPNDIVINGKKVCGILTEMSSEGLDINYVVVGIGINVNNKYFPSEIKDTATSIMLETGNKCSRTELIADITNEFEKYYNSFLAVSNLKDLVDEYNSRLVNCNRQVVVIEGEKQTEYTALGINEDGALRVKDALGNEKTIISGEVSVRGIYGYV
jgi:BirA family biotin operon repressor/biotin-[acetyl-CoA-carboxylase] ligase